MIRDLTDNEQAVLLILRNDGLHRVVDLVRKSGIKRAGVLAALEGLTFNDWVFRTEDDRYCVRSRREREAVLAAARLEQAVDGRALHELMELNDTERARLARLSRAAEEAQRAAWDADGMNRIRDADEPMADRC